MEEKKDIKEVQVNVNTTTPTPQKVFFNGKGQACTYDENGKVIPYGNNNTTQVYVEPPKKKIAQFIISIFALLLGIGALIFSVYYTLDFLNQTDSTEQAVNLLVFFLYLISLVGLAIHIPAFAFSITAICCSASAIKSSSKAIKGFSILILILSILTLTAVLISPFFILATL